MNRPLPMILPAPFHAGELVSTFVKQRERAGPLSLEDLFGHGGLLDGCFDAPGVSAQVGVASHEPQRPSVIMDAKSQEMLLSTAKRKRPVTEEHR